jgi:hypothetical protein
MLFFSLKEITQFIKRQCKTFSKFVILGLVNVQNQAKKLFLMSKSFLHILTKISVDIKRYAACQNWHLGIGIC